MTRIVETDKGPVRGVREQGLEVFKGIPYAAAPTGPYRWQPPQPAPAWIEPLDTRQFGPAAPQTPDELELDLDAPQSEDCLTLNVWTPGIDDGRRPVMVWIHGGAFSWGSARNDLYDGSQYAERGDVVVVTIQYRLGALGWLDLQPLGHDRSPNNGLLDQIAALEWVKTNIAAFGGDPNTVTVAGESAGGIAIGALLVSPQADGLFHRAILQSGSPGLVATKDWSTKVRDEFMKHAKADSVAELGELTTDQILDAQAGLFKNRFADMAFHPVIDGDVVPSAPIQHIGSATESTVPTLIGTNLDEARYWILEDGRLDQLPLSFVRPWLNAITGNGATHVIDAYQHSHPDYTDAQIGLAVAGDAAFRLPAIATAEALAASNTPVWMYLFTLASTRLEGRLGSPHAMELPFTFNNLGASGASAFFDSDAVDCQPLADTIQDAWVNFIRHGSPQTQALGSWPTYDTANRSTMILDHEPKLESNPFAGNRRAWGDIPFDGLTPSIGESSPTSYDGTRYVETALRMYAAKASAASSAIVEALKKRLQSR